MRATLQQNQRLAGIACVMFSLLVWSGWVVISSYGVHGSLTAFDITALRFGTAGLILLPVLLKKGLRVGPWGIWGGIWLAAMMGAPYNTVAVYGMKFASTAHASVLQSAMLILTTVGGIFLLREKTSSLRIGGLLISLIGIACLLQANTSHHPHQALGHLLFLLAGSMWAVYTVTVKAWKVDPLHVAAAVCVYSALFYLPIYFLFLPAQIGPDNWQDALFQALFQGIINSVFALICFNRAIALLGASTASAFLPLIPVIATLVAIPVLHETPSSQEWFGILLASSGVLLSTGIFGRWIGNKEKAVTV